MPASICGFSFGKDLIRLDYPAVEAVRSVLPLCDRFVFVVGRSDDDTRELVQSIDPQAKDATHQRPQPASDYC